MTVGTVGYQMYYYSILKYHKYVENIFSGWWVGCKKMKKMKKMKPMKVVID
tara:strand:+ start:27283 stop:27435 length:153 start_codon:yes stop_codon:yes gene_type:complete